MKPKIANMLLKNFNKPDEKLIETFNYLLNRLALLDDKFLSNRDYRYIEHINYKLNNGEEENKWNIEYTGIQKA